MKDDFQLKFFVKRIAKDAKRAVSFRIKNNETCETGCFAKHEISRNNQLVSRNNETSFASSFAKRVSLETLVLAHSIPKVLRKDLYGSLLEVNKGITGHEPYSRKITKYGL
jgi:hypothetical protein